MFLFMFIFVLSVTIFTQCALLYMAQRDIQSFDLVPACNQPHATLEYSSQIHNYVFPFRGSKIIHILLYKILIYRVIHSANPALFDLRFNKIISQLSLGQCPA